MAHYHVNILKEGDVYRLNKMNGDTYWIPNYTNITPARVKTTKTPNTNIITYTYALTHTYIHHIHTRTSKYYHGLGRLWKER